MGKILPVFDTGFDNLRPRACQELFYCNRQLIVRIHVVSEFLCSHLKSVVSLAPILRKIVSHKDRTFHREIFTYL